MIHPVTMLLGSKRVRLGLALTGAVAILASVLVAMPLNLRTSLRLAGLALNLIVWLPVAYADWKKHHPLHPENSTRSFLLIYSFFVLVPLVNFLVLLKDFLTNPH